MELVGEKIMLRRDLLLGGAMFSLLWILNLTIGLAIGFPTDLPFATTFTDAAVIIVLLAGPLEEIFFRIFFLTAQINLFNKIGITGLSNKALAVITNAIVFAGFHFIAYGSSFTRASAAFFGAGLVGIIFGVITIYTDSIVPATFSHMGFNLWLFLQKLRLTGSIAFAIGNGQMIVASVLFIGFQYYLLRSKRKLYKLEKPSNYLLKRRKK